MKHLNTAALLSLFAPLTVLAACGGSDCPDDGLAGSGGGGGGGGIDPTNFVSIADVTLPEGDTGTQTFQFPVTLNAALEESITVTFATVSGSAVGGGLDEDSDFVSRTGTVTMPPGTIETSIAIVIHGDQEYEGDETFTVDLQSVEGFDIAIGDSQAIGMIKDDDGNKFSISDVTAIEGDVTNPLFWFEVSLSTPQPVPVSVEYVTRNVSASDGPDPGDYIYRRDAVQFQPGETSKQFEIRVVGDLEAEKDEIFEIQLFDANGPNVSIGREVGIGTILDDDVEQQLDRAQGGSNASASQLAGVGQNQYSVWQDDRNGGTNIYFSRSTNHGLSWSLANRRIDTGPAGTATEPQLAAADDSVFVAWSDSRNGKSDIYFNRSLDNGATWLVNDVRLDTDFPGASSSTLPRIACSGELVYVVWTDWRTGVPSVRFRSSMDAGATWMDSDLQVNNPPGFAAPARDAQVSAFAGHVYVTWTDERHGSSEIYFDASPNGGYEWLIEDRRMNSTMPGSSTCEKPRMSCNDGFVFVVWEDTRNGTPDVYFNRSLNNGTTWLPFDVRLNDDTPGTASSTNPSICSGGERVMVAWESAKANEAEDIRFSSSEDAGSTWRGNARVDRGDKPSAARSLEPQVAWSADRVGVTWSDERNGERDVYLGWAENDESTFTTRVIRMDRDIAGSASSVHPHIISDGANFHVLWDDARITDDVLFRTVYLP